MPYGSLIMDAEREIFTAPRGWAASIPYAQWESINPAAELCSSWSTPPELIARRCCTASPGRMAMERFTSSWPDYGRIGKSLRHDQRGRRWR